jgi:hypothetical protein
MTLCCTSNYVALQNKFRSGPMQNRLFGGGRRMTAPGDKTAVPAVRKFIGSWMKSSNYLSRFDDF